MDKKWLLILDIERTLQDKSGSLIFCLQEINYDHPHMFKASDREAAIDYCVEILHIYVEDIK